MIKIFIAIILWSILAFWIGALIGRSMTSKQSRFERADDAQPRKPGNGSSIAEKSELAAMDPLERAFFRSFIRNEAKWRAALKI